LTQRFSEKWEQSHAWRFSNYSAFKRFFISVYAVSISFVNAAESTSRSSLSFTWRMNLPVPFILHVSGPYGRGYLESALRACVRIGASRL
jgi:hypothetical protein